MKLGKAAMGSDPAAFEEILVQALPHLQTRHNEIHTRISREFADRLPAREAGNPDVAIPAILLHDIGWCRVPGEQQLAAFGPNVKDPELTKVHEREGAQMAGEILSTLRCPEELTLEIVRIVVGHDTRIGSRSIHESVVRDADKLFRFSAEGFRTGCAAFHLEPAVYSGLARGTDRQRVFHCDRQAVGQGRGPRAVRSTMRGDVERLGGAGRTAERLRAIFTVCPRALPPSGSQQGPAIGARLCRLGGDERQNPCYDAPATSIRWEFFETGKTPTASERMRVMKLMVCYNGSEASKEALKVAVEYAKALSGNLHIVRSVPSSVDSTKNKSLSDSDLRNELSRIIDFPSGVDVVCVNKITADDMTDGENLVDYAIREHAETVFLGVRKVSKVGKLLFGSTAQFVILTAPCPVVSVKAVAAGA
ncbi:MAG: universal stress protein [Deferrisomatales bacterium]|nr:universal stress protein [Deferrisomatales bacterium]